MGRTNERTETTWIDRREHLVDIDGDIVHRQTPSGRSSKVLVGDAGERIGGDPRCIAVHRSGSG
jgi:hypothetical protein